jgi:molybdopterin molybdotransferase
MSLIPVEEALQRLLAGVAPLPHETVPLAEALDRVLAEDVAALLTQPPFPASAMDGYAVRAAEAREGAMLTVAGESRAGARHNGALDHGEAIRIFTGAPVPDGADSILIQENAERDGDTIRVLQSVTEGHSVRRAGLDFTAGDILLRSGRSLGARALALAASMGHGALPVRRKPRVAILANGDELVPPGAEPGPDQIVSSNGIGISMLVRRAGGEPQDLGIAPDRKEAIGAAVDRAAGADVLVIIGGASVGEHDLVQAALVEKGMELDFWKIAMRPGKPLMVGTLGGMRVLGLPGNPVSALVCAILFLKPLLREMLGLPTRTDRVEATLSAPLPANDSRQDYLRARFETSNGERLVAPFPRQDSSMLATLAAADALIVRPAHAPAAAAGEKVPVIALVD